MSPAKRTVRSSTFSPIVGVNADIVVSQPDAFRDHPVSPLIVRDVIARNLPRWNFYVTIPAATAPPFRYIVRGEWDQRKGFRHGQTISVLLQLSFDPNADLPHISVVPPPRGQGILHSNLHAAARSLELLLRCRLHNSTGRGLYAPATITK